MHGGSNAKGFARRCTRVELPVEYFIGLKYLRAKRKQASSSIVTVISILGVTVGVMALIIVLAVMSGFEKELKDRILGATAHVHVTSLEGSIADPFALARRGGAVAGPRGPRPQPERCRGYPGTPARGRSRIWGRGRRKGFRG